MRQSVSEVAYAGEGHREVVFICGGNHFVVADAAAGLDDGGDAVARGGVQSVAEGEEGVRGEYGVGGVEVVGACAFGSEADGIYAGHLTCADADGREVACVDDGVGFGVFADRPGEEQVGDFRVGGLAAGDDVQGVGCEAVRVGGLDEYAAEDLFELRFGCRLRRACA